MKRAVIAGILLKKQKDDSASLLEELKNLCEACEMEIAAEVYQQSEHMDPKTALRSGKLEELAMTVQETQAECIVFLNKLSVAAGQRISDITGVPVMDRTALILEIFSKRARSKQAKLQVEMARLTYALPRIADPDENEGHVRGGASRSRGAGEMRSAAIKRIYQSRIQDLKKQLADIDQQSRNAEYRRSKSMLAKAAIVGYTNAGKSSLMNALLRDAQHEDRQVFEKDMLFATLDTSVRQLTHKGQAFLLYDTVGFVSDLPHELVEAFHSTLDAARSADVLVHVIDASDPKWEEKATITEETLKQIHADKIPVLRVFNKIDLLENPSHVHGIAVSAKNQTGLEAFLDVLTEQLYPHEVSIQCLIPYDHQALMSQYYNMLKFDIIEHIEDGIRVAISGENERIKPFRAFEERGTVVDETLGQ